MAQLALCVAWACTVGGITRSEDRVAAIGVRCAGHPAIMIPLCPLPLEQALLVVCALVLGLVIGVQVNTTMWKG
eukprot:COSAG01_NODE_1464_length_10228_cov_6.040774_9_plen_74_part_00